MIKKQLRLEIFTFQDQINTRGGRNKAVLGCFHIIDEILAVTSSSDEFTSTDSILIDFLTTLFVDNGESYCYRVLSHLFV
jgi:hypothetical protein